jgi:hypothetical protein
MATILFAGHAVSLIVLPLMLFHQAQLFVCATLARRYAARPEAWIRTSAVARVQHQQQPAPPRAGNWRRAMQHGRLGHRQPPLEQPDLARLHLPDRRRRRRGPVSIACRGQRAA